MPRAPCKHCVPSPYVCVNVAKKRERERERERQKRETETQRERLRQREGERQRQREKCMCCDVYMCYGYTYLSLCCNFSIGIKADGIPLDFFPLFGSGCGCSSRGLATSIPWHTSEIPVHMATGKGEKGMRQDRSEEQIHVHVTYDHSIVNGHSEQVVNPKLS